ncbi:hypothetical protein Dsin_007062 [Dipteronia sinensis]|uniref:Uncharacterized protein n=1 Tax=Dipteronia sinensis TaxID=43782 RepID=A0AAE0EI21_9ROSI|nr:hypothetical protein Dsin_007062 [Dipteronia sinensis]
MVQWILLVLDVGSRFVGFAIVDVAIVDVATDKSFPVPIHRNEILLVLDVGSRFVGLAIVDVVTELCPVHFLDIFLEVRSCYATSAEIMEDRDIFEKGLVDTYLALLFSQAFIENCVSGKLESGEENMLKAYLMRMFAESIGYIVNGVFDTGHEQ